MGWAALMVGIALGLRQFGQQGLGVFGGAIADRFGAKPMIVTGMLLRAAGFATMAIAHEPAAVVLLFPFRDWRHFSTHRVPRWWLSLSVRNIGALLLDFDDAGQRWRGGGRPAGKLAAAIRFPRFAPPARCCLFSARCLTVCFCPHGSCRR